MGQKEETEMHSIADYLGGVVAIASILSNFIKPYTIAGKIVHFVAFNFAGQNGGQ
jgi:hypothetical protein